jgi:hypothetical protein
MTKIEIINETVNFYSEDTSRRSKNLGKCMYNSGDGRHCAIGRCFLPEYREQSSNFEGNSLGVEELSFNYDGLDKLLLNEYRGHSTRFWVDLQWIHDNDAFWGEHGLTDKGKDKVQELKERYPDTITDEIKALAKRFGISESQIKIIKGK